MKKLQIRLILFFALASLGIPVYAQESPEAFQSVSIDVAMSRAKEKLKDIEKTVRNAIETQKPLQFLPIWSIPVNWRYAKQQFQQSLDRVSQVYDQPSRSPDQEIRKSIDDIWNLVNEIESNEQKNLAKTINFFKSHPVKGISFEEWKARAEFVRDLHLLMTYGWLGPQAFNEGWEEATKQVRIPGYPIKTYITKVDYCTNYGKYAFQMGAIIEQLDPNFFPPSDGNPGICDDLLLKD